MAGIHKARRSTTHRMAIVETRMSFNLCLLGHSEALLPICARSSTLPARPPDRLQFGRLVTQSVVQLTKQCRIDKSLRNQRWQPNSQQSNKFETSKLPGVPAFTDILPPKRSDPRACTSISGIRSMSRCSKSTYNSTAAGIVLMEPGDTDREAVGRQSCILGDPRPKKARIACRRGVMELCPRMRSSLCFRYCAGDMLCSV